MQVLANLAAHEQLDGRHSLLPTFSVSHKTILLSMYFMNNFMYSERGVAQSKSGWTTDGQHCLHLPSVERL